ncbi:ABC transporter permease [Phyllobacterium sp. SB3]|uniref:ABC transporter permease n=1 Tax=Phyllobacterium sp. SB3 TaxID=3156073 RepID=UPI0032AF21D3
MMTKVRYLAIPTAFMAVFFLGPLLSLLTISFTEGYPLGFMPSINSYLHVIFDSYYLEYLLTTIAYGLIVTVLCLLIGYPFAYYMARYARASYNVMLVALVSPLLIGVVVRTVGWTILFGSSGLFNQTLLALGIINTPLQILYTPLASTIGMVQVLLPFMVLSIISVLSNMDASVEEAACSLGAGRLTVFLRVTLPLSIRGVASGCVLVFALTIGAYLTPVLLGGGKSRLMSPLIYQEINSLVDWSLGAALSVVLLIVGVTTMAIVPRLVMRIWRT